MKQDAPIRLAALASLAWASAAAAQGLPTQTLPSRPPQAAAPGVKPAPPLTRPTRDVVVTYAVEGQALSAIPGGVSGPVRLSWDAAGQRIRAEAEGRSQVALIDLRARAGQAFDTTLRVVLPLPIRPGDIQPLTLDGARLTPRGKEVVAGLSCNAYAVETGQGNGSVCLTPDGVALRGQGLVDGKPGTFKALSVSYGALPPTLFQVPPGYVALGGPGGANAGGLAGLADKLGIGGSGGALGALGNSLGIGRGGK